MQGENTIVLDNGANSMKIGQLHSGIPLVFQFCIIFD